MLRGDLTEPVRTIPSNQSLNLRSMSLRGLLRQHPAHILQRQHSRRRFRSLFSFSGILRAEQRPQCFRNTDQRLAAFAQLRNGNIQFAHPAHSHILLCSHLSAAPGFPPSGGTREKSSSERRWLLQGFPPAEWSLLYIPFFSLQSETDCPCASSSLEKRRAHERMNRNFPYLSEADPQGRPDARG